ncbi:MAG: PorP/SprF family type IX secretion system membrane protein [Flavobacteriales bacterium]|nr:PorP/SprF family type IX secretion system membrane protein [Flavobacteriales bacterium]
MKLRITLISLLAVAMVHGQDIHMSQFQNAPLLINPALTGDFTGFFRAGISYRDQWSVLGDGFVSYMLYADYRPGEDENTHTIPYSFGVMAARDKGGDLGYGNMNMKLSGSKEVRFSPRQKMLFGLQMGVIQSSVDLEGYRWGSQYDGNNWNSSLPGELITLPKRTGFDASTGFVWVKSIGASTLSAGDVRYIETGLAVHHLTRPKISFSPFVDGRLPLRYTAHFTGLFGVENTLFSFQPLGLFEWQGNAMEVSAGCNLRIRLKEASRYTGLIKASIVGFGLQYRYGDAIIPTFMYDNQTVAFYAGYDFNVSSLSKVTRSNGAMEFTLRYVIAAARRH